MEISALFKLSYGLYVLTANQDGFDNGCIINTAMQVTDTPLRMIVVVNKTNKTYEMIHQTKKFNVSTLSQEVPFDYFKQFGFQSGRDVNKFEAFNDVERSENGILYIKDKANTYISGSVVDEVDLGTHAMFVADVKDAKVLNNVESCTYSYYHANIKPKPQPKKEEKEEGKAVWVCQICGYVYEGDPIPDDFVCPWCKHGAKDFKKEIR